MRKIVFEHLFHLRGELLIDDERRDFEIKAEGSIVEVRRADRGEFVVDERNLLVQEPGFVGIEPNAEVAELVDVVKRRQEYRPAVRLPGGDDPDVNTPHCRKLQRRHYGGIRDKIRRGQPDSLAGRMKRGHEKEFGCLEAVRRRERDDHRTQVIGFRGFRLPVQIGQFARGPIPVGQYRALQLGHHRALQLHVRIAPRTEIGVQSQVLVTDIETADPTRDAVHHDHLAMIPEVELKPITPPLGRLERTDLHTSRPQFFYIAFRQPAAADLVVQDEDTNPGICAFDQCLLDAPAEAVVVDHVELEQDVLAGPGDAFENAVEGRVTVNEQLCAVAGCQVHVREAAQRLVGRRTVVCFDVPGREVLLILTIDMIDLVGALLVGCCKALELAAPENQVGRHRDEWKRDE